MMSLLKVGSVVALMHISDTHFGTEVPPVVKAVQQSAAQLKPDAVILTGDITQRARPQQFEDARIFLHKLPTPLHIAIPGNHDIPLYHLPLRLFAPYRQYKKYMQHPRHSLHQIGPVTLLALDATQPLRHTRGDLSESYLREWLGKADKMRVPNGILIVAAHQPLEIVKSQDQEERLISYNNIARLYAEYKVDMALSGHVHFPLITSTAEPFPALPRHFILGGAGTAVSHRIRSGAPNSFNVIRYDSETGHITVELYEYRAEEGSFAISASHRFTRDNKGWIEIVK
jgi:3',5'-cyclic AMP phosphodiesterase CpdA